MKYKWRNISDRQYLKFFLSSIALLLIVLAGYFVFHLRIDLTSDKRYSLHAPYKSLLGSLDAPLRVICFLDGSLNSGFARLHAGVNDFVAESAFYAEIEYVTGSSALADSLGLVPTAIYERDREGKTTQASIYPYILLKYKTRSMVLSILHNNRTLSGEENLNQSLENLEFLFAQALHTLRLTERRRVAFLEGHGELSERDVYDLTLQLAQYFDVDRGVVGTDPLVLSPYSVLIVAQPQKAFSDADKFIIDQYIMRGGAVLWLLNGVYFSEDLLSAEGFTPIMPCEVRLSDMLFRYGVRVNADLVQDMQCLPVPVNVSAEAAQPNYQPMYWTYSPLLLTSSSHAITRNVAQLKSVFASTLNVVGEEDGLQKSLLLYTSNASKITPSPGKVDLSDFNVDATQFNLRYLPTGVLLEGIFPSFFAHRMIPEGIEAQEILKQAQVKTSQIVVSCGSIAQNDWQNNAPLPVGFDRYTKMQFGNKDFLVNAVLYLAGDGEIISLRNNTLALRLLNDKKLRENAKKIQVISIIFPIISLSIVGICVCFIRRKKYQ